tara:strand:- start:401 stop:946 length:546 start_codon:yes stop_codon:yes gene_type:complete
VRPTKIGEEEIDMTFQFNFSQAENANFTVTSSALENARLALRHANFEILEIWHEGEEHIYEIWQNTVSGTQIRLDIEQDDVVEEEPSEATRQDVVNELVDLWIELRAIRRHFTEAPDYFDECENIERSTTPLQRFWLKVREFELERAADPELWSFIFNTGVDETVCAYNELSAQDRLAITH